MTLTDDCLSSELKPLSHLICQSSLAQRYAREKRRVENVMACLHVTPQMACDSQLSLMPCSLLLLANRPLSLCGAEGKGGVRQGSEGENRWGRKTFKDKRWQIRIKCGYRATKPHSFHRFVFLDKGFHILNTNFHQTDLIT